ncbi:MAG TPA: glutaredoxin, partial [Albitalea sp.]|nr:glutaredoxin [Albitalea sp.]
GVDMNDEELALSRSTPGYRFDAAPAPAPVAAARPSEPAVSLDEQAHSLVAQAIQDHAVVMFALEWCEFCWAVRKLLTRLRVPFKSVDIDSVALQQHDMGTKVRAVLKERTGAPTIPQIWIGGTHVGGAQDLFDALRSGRLQQLLSQAGVAVDRDTDIDADEFLPQWLHPRKAA